MVHDIQTPEEEEQAITPLSPENIQKMLREQYNAILQSGQAVPVARVNAEDSINAASERRSIFATENKKRADSAIALFRTSSDRRTELEQYPDLITDFLSLIDQDFDPDVMVQRMQRAQFELGVVSSDAKTADAMFAREVKTAERNLKATTDIFNFNREGFFDLANAAKIGFELRSDTRQEHVQFVKDQSDKQLKEWEKHPGSMPRIIRNNPQLVSAELFMRKLKSTQLLSVERANAQQLNALLNEQREDFLDGYDNEGLAIAYEAFQRDPRKFPDYMRDRDFKSELENQDSILLSLGNARNALAQNNIELLEKNKLIALKQSSLRDVDKILLEMGNATSIDLLDVPFSRTELELAQATKVKTARETDRVNALLVKLIDNTDVNRKATMRMAELIAKFDNPYGTNSTLPPALEQTLGGIMNMDKRLDPIVRSGNVGAAQVQAQGWEAGAKEMQDEIDKIVASQVKRKQAGVAEYFRTGGFIFNAGNAADVIMIDGSNAFILDGSPLLAGAQHAFAKELASIASISSFTFDPTGGFSSSKGDRETAVLIQQAIDNSGFRKLVADAGYQALLQSSLIDLIKLSEPVKDVATTGKLGPTSIYAGLINPQTGALSRSLYKLGADGSRVFSFHLLNEAYADIQNRALKDGVVKADEMITDPILSLMRERVADLNLAFRQSPYTASLGTAAFPNGVDSMLHEALRDTVKKLPGIIALAVKQQRALEIVIEQNLIAETEGPGLGSLVD